MASDVVPADDRGLAYGDGVFRTLAVREGRPVHWDRQYAKLTSDCARLAIPGPDAGTLHEDVLAVAAEHRDAAVKIIITRGSGERGYRPPSRPRPNRIVIGSPLPVHPAERIAAGVAVYVCRTRFATQPLLAGVKHLNRLENVLAHAEWSTDDYAEGLIGDEGGNIVSGTMTNLFIVEAGCLRTPELTRCGVAGVTRELVMERAAAAGVACEVAELSLERIKQADEVLLTNSLIGVWRVRSIAGADARECGMAQRLRTWLDESGTGR